MNLYFVRVQTRFEDFNIQLRAMSKEIVESTVREDYGHKQIYQIDITDITWSELEAAE